MKLYENTNEDEMKLNLGYNFKLVSNMKDFKPIYFKEKDLAELEQSKLINQWKLINVYVLLINLSE